MRSLGRSRVATSVCPGVEVVAHSLRDTLHRHRDSKFGLLKIDFRNAFNEIKRSHFVKTVGEMFPAMSTGPSGATARSRCCSTITSMSSSLGQEFSRVTLWALCTSVVASG